MRTDRPFPDIARGEVIPDYTPERVSEVYMGKPLECLLQLPPEERQNFMAEVNRRAYRTKLRRVSVRTQNDTLMVLVQVRPPYEVMDEVLAEYLAWKSRG